MMAPQLPLRRPRLIYKIVLSDRLGLFILRDGKDRELGQFRTMAEAEREAQLLFPDPLPRFLFRSRDT